MGTYINVGNAPYQSARNGEYVDKSPLIAVVNKSLFSKQRFSCITRCRRFGKSMAAEMLCAYYDHSCDSRSLFADLQIAHDPQFERHLNKYPVIYLDISDFVTRFKDETIVKRMDAELIEDIHKVYADIPNEEALGRLSSHVNNLATCSSWASTTTKRQKRTSVRYKKRQ